MSKPEKIVFIGLETYGLMGGLQQFNRRFIKALASRAAKSNGIRPQIVLRRDQTSDMPTDVDADFRPCGTSVLRMFHEAMGAARGADILVAGHVNLLPVLTACSVIAPRAPRILVVHGDEVWGDPVYRERKPFDAPMMRRLDRVVSVSQFTANRMAKAFGLSPEMFSIFRNAVDEIPSPDQTQPKQPNILCVTRLAEHDHGKNVDKLLRAFAVLKTQNLEATLTIVGDGVLRHGLEKLSLELGISEHVRFTGRVSDKSLAAAYASASVFCLPSEKEGFGIVYLEAWLRGLPVICGDRDAAQEIVSDGVDGYIVDPSNIEEFASQLGKLLAQTETAREIGARGRSKVEAQYLMPHFENQLKSILDSVKA
ncbi:glycosyltransferase family 4 protein [Ruegeria atlantica]|uniref:glycosyltransferase family 4 protein n=1 Tax=Ruegeria atlantica TaxID=81569 RepID=UPI00147B0BC1|nr:glycosyltransferase family 4 protein [Ruegeria atlantica]